ncbi:MAG: tetratricopeptide repeat protein [Chitinivibrionales bacterium]|nr:tetratricopeptide repeat protein [Chitinivibrionales bacterium]
MRRSIKSIAVVFALCSMIIAAPSKSGSSEAPVLLLARAVEASAMGAVANAWFSALAESYYRLRLQPLDGIEVLPVDKLRETVPGFENFGRSVAQETLLNSARSLGATHILTHNYEIDHEQGSVYYYVEVFTAKDNDIVLTFEKSFPLGELGNNLDACTNMLLEKLNVKVPPKLSKTMKTPLLSGDARSLQMLGAAIFEAQELPPARAAEGFMRVTQRDVKMALAYYEAAQRYAQVPDYTKTAQMLDHLVVQRNFGYPELYAQLSKYYRLGKSYERALHAISRAEKEGWNTLEIALEKAQILEKTGNTAKAVEAYQQVLSINPNQPDALLLMSRRNRIDKKYAEAAAKADRLIKQGQHLGEAYREKGLALFAQKKYDAAETALLEAAKRLKDDAEINVALGELYAKKKAHLKAAQHYEKALQGMPNNLEVLLNVAKSYRQAKRPQDALAVLVKNQKHFYTSKEVTREIGLLEFEMRDTASARKHLEASVNLTPPDGRVFLYLGDIYAAAKETDKAIAMYEKAEGLVEDKLKPRAALAKLYLTAKQPDKAQAYLQKILAVKASYPEANLMMADILLGKKQYKQALKYYLNERKFHGNTAPVQKGVALCYYGLEDLPNAGLGFRKLVEIDPKDGEAYDYLAEISLKLGKLDEVRTYISQAEVLGKKDPSLYLQLAKAYEAGKQYSKAADAYQSNIKAVPKNEEAWIGLGRVYERAKKDSLAAQAYYQAYTLNPQKHEEYLGKAGHILHKSGNKARAAQIYQEFLSKGHADPKVSVNMARMAFDQKKYQDVISLLSGLKGAEADDVDVLRMLAESYAATKKTSEALIYAKKLVAKKPKDKDALELAAESYEKAGDLKNAASMYRRYLQLPKTSKHQEYAYHLAQLLVEAKQGSLAAQQYKKNIAEYPSDYRNHKDLGELLLQMNQYTNATKLLARPAARSDAPPQLNLVLAKAYTKLGKKAQAAASYERYLSKEQSDSSAWHALGSIYYGEKAYQKAVKPLTRASVLMPKNSDVLYKLGMSLYYTKKLREAVDPLSKVLLTKSKDKKVLSALTECYRSLNDTAQLIATLQKRVSVEPGNYDLSNELGNLLMAKGDIQSAISTLEQASRAKPSDIGLHMQLASLYGRIKDTRNQLVHIDAALSHAPKNPDVAFEKAHFHLMNNQPVEAKKYLKKTIDLNPKHVRALALHGSMLKGEKKYRQAYEHFSQAVKYAPKSTEYMLQMAQCAHMTGKNDLALKVVTKALQLDPSDPGLMQWAGVFYLKDNKEEKAELMLRRALEIDKNCGVCDEYLGQIYLARGEFEAATQHLETALRKGDGRNDNVMVKLARALLMKGEADRAQDLCNKALAINMQNDEALYLLCDIYIDRGGISNAEQILSRNKGTRTSGWIYLAQGRIHEAKGDIASAMSSYKLASRVLPSNADMQMGLGRVYLARKNWSEAIQAFGMASALEPSNPKIFVGMGKAYLGQGDMRSAKEFFAEAARIQPAQEEAHFMMGLVAAKEGEPAAAVRAIKTGLRYAPESGRLNYLLGQQYEAVKEHDDALEAYEDAAKHDPKLAAKAYKEMGDIYFSRKDARNAKKYYERHLDAGGKDPAVKQALRKLN